MCTFKGTVSHNFQLRFFPGQNRHASERFRFFPIICRDNYLFWCSLHQCHWHRWGIPKIPKPSTALGIWIRITVKGTVKRGSVTFWCWTCLTQKSPDAEPIWNNTSDSKLIRYRTHLILNSSDSKQIRYQTYLVLNLSDTESFWYWTCLILNLSDTKPIWYRTYLIPNLSVPNLSDTEPI